MPALCAVGIVNLSCLVAFSPASSDSKLLIPGFGSSRIRFQNGRISLNLAVPYRIIYARFAADRVGLSPAAPNYSVFFARARTLLV